MFKEHLLGEDSPKKTGDFHGIKPFVQVECSPPCVLVSPMNELTTNYNPHIYIYIIYYIIYISIDKPKRKWSYLQLS